MILQQVIMKQTIGKQVGIKKDVSCVNKIVFLWTEIGLCVHKGELNQYVISHYKSGRSVLKFINTRQEAEKYMGLLKEVLEDWTFTEKEWNEYPQIDKSLIKERVDILQKEIREKGE